MIERPIATRHVPEPEPEPEPRRDAEEEAAVVAVERAGSGLVAQVGALTKEVNRLQRALATEHAPCAPPPPPPPPPMTSTATFRFALLRSALPTQQAFSFLFF